MCDVGATYSCWVSWAVQVGGRQVQCRGLGQGHADVDALQAAFKMSRT